MILIFMLSSVTKVKRKVFLKTNVSFNYYPQRTDYQQRVLGTKNANGVFGCIRPNHQQVKRGDYSPLVSVDDATLKACPVLGQ